MHNVRTFAPFIVLRPSVTGSDYDQLVLLFALEKRIVCTFY